jgi:hypothetical protein
VREQPGARRPQPRIGTAPEGQGCGQHANSHTSAGSLALRVELVADDLLDQPVHAQHLLVRFDQRKPA